MKKANQKSRRNPQSAMQKQAYADMAVRSITTMVLLIASLFNPYITSRSISTALGIEEIGDKIIQESSTEKNIMTQPVTTQTVRVSTTTLTSVSTTITTTTTTTEVTTTTTETEYVETEEEYYYEEYYEYEEEDYYYEENYEYQEEPVYENNGQNTLYFEGTYYGVYGFDGVTPTGMGTSGASGNSLISGGSIALNDEQRASLGLQYGDYIYLESASHPSINGSYRIDDCGCSWGVINLFYWAYTTDYMPYDLLTSGRVYDLIMYY